MISGEQLYVILLGAPGAGKGTQAALISQRLGLAHIASGDLFRQEQASGSELGKVAKSYMEKGLLVPDEVTVKMILGRIAAPDCAQGVLLDGFPRTLEQAKALDEALAEEGKRINMVLYIKVSNEELLRRLSGRWICRNCQAPYNIVELPSKVPGKCDACGGELYQRPDDTAETARKRLDVYFTQTMPLIEYYTKAGKLVEIDGEKGIEEVGEELVAAIEVRVGK
ncbi:MAG TPA: adenylate kinase [Dehalococcoidia bacterium]|nr:adenylate kinase [Dehalococcoidia bacterium]